MSFPKQIKIVYDRNGCIGAAACAAINPEDFVMNDDGKADLAKAEHKEENRVQERIIDESELDANMEAAKSCPVTVIHIFDLETGEQLI